MEKGHNSTTEMPIAEQPRPIFIIARTNDLFEQFIPVIASALQQTSRVVDVKTFPKESSYEEINLWCKSNRGDLSKKEILADYTCEGEIDNIEQSYINFEKLISNAIMQTVFGKNMFEVLTNSEDSFEMHGQAIFQTLDFVFNNNPDIKPSKMYIVRNHLTDHFPFRLNDSPIFSHQNQHNNPPEFLTEILEKLTIPAIETVDSVMDVPETIFDPTIHDKMAVMADRHEMNRKNYYSYKDEPKTQQLGRQGKLFLLPFESLYSLLKQVGHTRNSEEVAANLCFIVKDLFDK